MTYFKNITAVIIEDEPFIAADIEGLLQDFGIEVLKICSTVDEGIKAAKAIKADIFTLDYELGNRTSDPVANTLKKHSKKFIVISGKTEIVQSRSNFTETPLISKPVDPKALVKAIEVALY